MSEEEHDNDVDWPVSSSKEREFNESLFGHLDALDRDTLICHALEALPDLHEKPNTANTMQRQNSSMEMHENFRTDLDELILPESTSEVNVSTTHEELNLDESTLDEDGMISDITTKMTQELNDINSLTVTSTNVVLPGPENPSRYSTNRLDMKDKAEDTQVNITQIDKDIKTLNRNLNNRQTVFQAIYYYHRSIGGEMEIVIKMKEVAQMFPEIIGIMKSGHGLIPGALAKQGLVMHFEKGKGTYKITEKGIATALEYGW